MITLVCLLLFGTSLAQKIQEPAVTPDKRINGQMSPMSIVSSKLIPGKNYLEWAILQ